MLCYKINCFDVQSVSEVFLLAKSIIGNVNPADGLVAKNIGPEIGSISHTFHLSAKIPRETMIFGAYFSFRTMIRVTAKMPFAYQCCCVAMLMQYFRQGNVGGLQCLGGIRSQIIENADMGWMLSCEQSCSVWGTYRCGGVGVSEPDAFSGQTIQVWGFMKGIAITPQFGPPQIIGKHEDNIWVFNFSVDLVSGVALYGSRQQINYS